MKIRLYRNVVGIRLGDSEDFSEDFAIVEHGSDPVFLCVSDKYGNPHTFEGDAKHLRLWCKEKFEKDKISIDYYDDLVTIDIPLTNKNKWKRFGKKSSESVAHNHFFNHCVLRDG